MIDCLNDIIRVPFTMEPYMFKFQGNPISPITYKGLLHKINETPPALSDCDVYFPVQQKHDDIIDKIYTKIQKYLAFVPTDRSLLELSLFIEEDIGVLYNGKLIAGHFASPTNWNPLEKKDMSLEDIHKPVADNKNLLRAMKGMHYAICGNYMFRRHVWTIAPTDNLSMHPKYKDQWKEPEKIDDLFLRIETQTTVPIIKKTTAIFLVKVDIVPLLEVFKTHKNLIIESINSMSENVLMYKNLHNVKTIINQTVGEDYV